MTEITADDLRKKQSVRATFKLPQQTISLLSVVARQLGVKQKSLFDQLNDNPKTLSQLVQDSHSFVRDRRDRQQKTFVISRNALLSVNQTAKEENISRDLLVELSISRLLPVAANELEKHEKRKELLVDMEGHLQQGKRILRKADKLLGEDDPLVEMVRKQVSLSQKNIAQIHAILQQGVGIEGW